MKPIYEQLSNLKFRHTDLLEEYLDHYATQYEHMIQNGILYEDALQTISNNIKALDVKEINRHHFLLHNKTLIMTLSGLLLMLASFYFSLNVSQDPPSKSPVALEEGTIRSGFGQRMHPVKKILKLHKGVDIIASLGTNVSAPGDGVVSDVGFDENYGYFIEIKHDEIYSTRYHHLSKVLVKKGDKIKVDQKIGEIGSTGLSTGPHLHYEVIENGKHVDPMPYIKA